MTLFGVLRGATKIDGRDGISSSLERRLQERDTRAGGLSGGPTPKEIQHHRRSARNVVSTALQVHHCNLHVSDKGLKVYPGHWNCPDQCPPTICSAGQCGQIASILFERITVEFRVAANKYVDCWIRHCLPYHEMVEHLI
jgi:hypothetical protein